VKKSAFIPRYCILQRYFQRYSVFFIVDSRQLYKFYTSKMAKGVSKPPRSGRSHFFHDLVTVDFHQIYLKTGVRIAIILIIVTVLGLITGYAADAGFVVFAALSVLLTELPP
jgi:hypothetical protein